MSGIALIFQRQPAIGDVDGASMTAMMRAMRHRGLHGSRVVTENRFLLGFQRFDTTPQGTRDAQPLRDSWGATYVAFDGRLDNRRELGRRLGLRGPKRGEMSDAALVMAAWESYDVDCFKFLEGAFAIVILDMRRNRAVMARDPLGTKSLYYARSRNQMVAASEEAAVLAHPSVSDAVNQTRLAQHLAFEFPHDESTFFEDVSQLLPGEVLSVDSTAFVRRKFFDPTDIAPIFYRNESDYYEQYLELLRKSVRNSMRAIGAPALMLSGGLDSTTIAALMNEIDGRVDAFSWRFDELTECDESMYIDDIARSANANVGWIKGDDCWPLKNRRALEVQSSHPLVNPYRELKSRTYSAAAKAGHRVLLTGVGGDELYLEDGLWLRDLLKDGRFDQALSGVAGLLRDDGPLAALRGRAVREAMGLGALKFRGENKPAWLNDEAWQRVCDSRQSVVLPDHLKSREKQFLRLFGPLAAEDAARESAHDSASGVEVRAPFRNVALARYVLAVPAWTIHAPGEPRKILRRAMREILPISILNRKSKTSFVDLFRRGIYNREAESLTQLINDSKNSVGLHLNEQWLDTVAKGPPESPFEEAVFWNCLGAVMWMQELHAAEDPLRMIA